MTLILQQICAGAGCYQAARTYTPRTVCLSLLFCPTSGLSKDPLIQFPWEDLYQRDTHMHRMLT